MRTGRPYSHQQTAAARIAVDEGRVPFEAFYPYSAQVHSAFQRQIEFHFTIEDWWNWWQVDGRWHHRGKASNKLVMARQGDKGPYSVDNVYSCTQAQNARDRDGIACGAAIKASWDRMPLEKRAKWHLAVRGDGHPKSRPVIAPDGQRYGSARLAAESYNKNPSVVQRWAREMTHGWRYEST